jgi:probable phosphoglycerate mutase
MVKNMKLIFIRHGDPDYSNDTLTEKGKKEAELLASRIPYLGADEYYVSPLGRASLTAKIATSGMDINLTTLNWLREFDYPVRRPDSPDHYNIAWDWMPADWTPVDALYDAEHWMEHPVFASSGIDKKHEEVTKALDEFLLEHGYKREGRKYRALRPNNDRIVLFSHFGLTALVLSHLIGISPMIIWQGFISAPTSVTTIVTEERRPGEVQWRCTGFGDVSHLYVAGEEPSFSGRFCECFTNENERH